MIVHEMANYHEINSFCRNEGLDTEYFLYELKKNKRPHRQKKLLILGSLLRSLLY